MSEIKKTKRVRTLVCRCLPPWEQTAAVRRHPFLLPLKLEQLAEHVTMTTALLKQSTTVLHDKRRFVLIKKVMNIKPNY